jgi:hypothetical protein
LLKVEDVTSALIVSSVVPTTRLSYAGSATLTCIPFQRNSYMNSLTSITPKALRRAADIQERISRLQTELTQILGGEVPALAVAKVPAAPKKRKMSAAGRAAIAAAAKARWAKFREAKAKTLASPKRQSQTKR